MKKNNQFQIMSMIVSLVLLLLVLSGATYAWFTHNRTVSTDKATSRTAEDSVDLFISSTGGSSFKRGTEADIVQINDANKEYLLPVSTADLKHFFFSTSAEGNDVTSFMEDTDGKYYYHGQVFLQAVITGQNAGKKLDLYLNVTDDEEAGGLPIQIEKGAEGENAKDEILNASRLGLTFDGGEAIILSVSDASNKGDEDLKTRTILNGEDIGYTKVLSVKDGALTAVNDPAKPISAYSISLADGSAKLPDNPLITMEPNKIYTVDIYYYLEGCDPDCNQVLALQECNLHLAFYGVLN